MDNVGSVLGEFLVVTLFTIFFDLLVRTPGYFICAILFTRSDVHPEYQSEVDGDGTKVAIVGIMFWLVLAGSAYGMYALIR